jgi:hypothetical protein
VAWGVKTHGKVDEGYGVVLYTLAGQPPRVVLMETSVLPLLRDTVPMRHVHDRDMG